MSRFHVLVELVRLVHLVCLGLFGVQPALQEFGIVFCQRLIPLFDLPELQL